MKDKLRIKKNFKNKLSAIRYTLKASRGFTLIEILVVLSVLLVIGSILTGILVSSLRGSNKVNSIDNVRTKGNYALEQMGKMIRYSQSFNGVSTDGVTYKTDCTPPIASVYVSPVYASAPTPSVGFFSKLTSLIQGFGTQRKKELFGAYSILANQISKLSNIPDKATSFIAALLPNSNSGKQETTKVSPRREVAAATSPSPDYTFCANEGQPCSFSGTKWVAFGADGKFYYLIEPSGVSCTTGVFGEPDFGAVKACYYSPNPPGYTFCSSEWGTCLFTGTKSVAFGVNGSFSYANMTSPVSCTSGVLGDPAPGYTKACYYGPIAPTGYTWCAYNGGTCTFPGTANVAYGVNGLFSYANKTNSVPCYWPDLEDLAPGDTTKNCFYKLIIPPVLTNPYSTAVTATTATITSSADPNGLATTGWFRLYTSNPGACDDTVPGIGRYPSSGGFNLLSGIGQYNFSQDLIGLTASTAYYICAFANSSGGTGVSAPSPPFTTLPAPNPNLKVTSISGVKANYNPGEAMSINVITQNNSSVNVSSPFDVDYKSDLLSGAPAPSCPPNWSSYTLPGLAANTFNPRTGIVATAPLASGNYKVGVFVDGNCTVIESNETVLGENYITFPYTVGSPVATPTLGPPSPSPTPSLYHYVKLTGFDGGQTILSCIPKNSPLSVAPEIASYSGTLNGNKVNLIDTGTTTSTVNIDSCSITCTQGTAVSPPTVTIQFSLSNITTSGLSENQAAIPFQTSVTVRNY